MAALDVIVGPAPCDACRHRVRCAEQLLACSAYSMFFHGEGEKRWRAAPRAPTRGRYEQLLGDEPHKIGRPRRVREAAAPHAVRG